MPKLKEKKNNIILSKVGQYTYTTTKQLNNLQRKNQNKKKPQKVFAVKDGIKASRFLEYHAYDNESSFFKQFFFKGER